MCLGITGQLLEIQERELRYGRVDFGEAQREVCLEYVPEARAGDRVIVHAGFAMSVVDEIAASRRDGPAHASGPSGVLADWSSQGSDQQEPARPPGSPRRGEAG